MYLSTQLGKYQGFYDEEFAMGDWLNSDWRSCWVPFLYYTDTGNIVELPRTMYLFDIPYDEAYLLRIKKIMKEKLNQ